MEILSLKLGLVSECMSRVAVCIHIASHSDLLLSNKPQQGQAESRLPRGEQRGRGAHGAWHLSVEGALTSASEGPTAEHQMRCKAALSTSFGALTEILALLAV